MAEDLSSMDEALGLIPGTKAGWGASTSHRTFVDQTQVLSSPINRAMGGAPEG